MKTLAYLVFGKRGVLGARKSMPHLRSGEFAIRLRLEIPDSYFAPEVPVADLVVPERAVLVPIVRVELPDELAASPAEEGSQ